MTNAEIRMMKEARSPKSAGMQEKKREH